MKQKHLELARLETVQEMIRQGKYPWFYTWQEVEEIAMAVAAEEARQATKPRRAKK